MNGGVSGLECKENVKKVNSLWSWFYGNGNLGAGERLRVLENVTSGKEGDTAAMKVLKTHLDWHDKMSGRRWELFVGLGLVLVTQIIILFFK
jgi:hypothetical protein